MKAVIYDHYGGPEVLELADVAPPKMHVDSVLVRVYAAAVNPADLAMRAGHGDATVPTYFPVIPGWDIAGVVEQVGLASPSSSPATRSSATSARASPTSTAATPSRSQPSHTR